MKEQYHSFETLETSLDNGVLTITFDNPPVNVVSSKLVDDLSKLIKLLHQDEEVKVVVFKSANPDFFLAHYDMMGSDPLPKRQQKMTDWCLVCAELPSLPQATIAIIEGRARGAGNEFLLACDMRFAAKGRVLLSQPEVAVGLIPGAGGTHRLEKLIGRGRTMEYVLSGKDISGEDAERYGWVNRVFESNDLHHFVSELANRIAQFPLASINATKCALNAESLPSYSNLVEEQNQFLDLVHKNPETQALLTKYVQSGAQTLGAMELNTGEEIMNLYK